MQISRSTQDSIVKAFRNSETRVKFVNLSKLNNALTSINNSSKSIGQIPSTETKGKLEWIQEKLTTMQTTLEGQGSKKLDSKSNKISAMMTKVANLIDRESPKTESTFGLKGTSKAEVTKQKMESEFKQSEHNQRIDTSKVIIQARREGWQ